MVQRKILMPVEPLCSLTVKRHICEVTDMKKVIITSALAAVLGLGSVSLSPVNTMAQGVELEIGRDGPKLRLRDNCDPDWEDCRIDRRDTRSIRRDRDRDGPRFCTDGRALDKAERMGIRRARIESSGRRTVEVRGRSRSGERVVIAFGRQPNCPIID